MALDMPTRLPPTTRTGTSIVCGKGPGLLDEQLAVVLIVLANEFVDLVQVRAKRERPADCPWPHEDVGIFERSVILERIVIRPAEALDNVEGFAVLVAAELRFGVEADGVHY